ncbi:hypothetical protein [Paenibacillus zanthoxyli]|uniref:hypothetical protein n=1 Tax=Paenibacillus zanthoxyli TaxID=369399 RepID=UPI000471D510|nr:hypothetical protein [Paenibacillus zanthoxyli]
MATTTPNPYATGIRDALNKRGIGNGRVGYSNGYVTVDGNNFMKADYNNKGTTYTSQGNFDKAYASLPQPKQAQISPMAQAAANVNQAVYTPPQSRVNQTLDTLGQTINKNAGFQFTAPATPFTYDAASDPAYQAALANAKSSIADQQIDTNAQLRAGGQGKSSYSETVANQIADKEMSNLANTLVPQLMQQAYQRYTDDANRNLQVQQLNYGVGQDAASNLSNLYGLQYNQDYTTPMNEAQLTGNYLPPEAKQAIQNILAYKQQAEAKGVTADQRSQISAQADQQRAILQSLGIDPSFYAATRTANQASQNNPAIRTLAGQAQDLQAKQANLSAAATVADITGRAVTPQSDWQGLFRQAANSNAPLTAAQQAQQFNQGMATRQQNFSEGQQTWQNHFQTEQFAYQQARDSISDAQWKAKFDEDVRQYGLNYGLQQLQQQNDQAYREATLGIQQDENARAWLQYGDSQQPTASKYNGMTANQIYDAVRSSFTTTDADGNKTFPTDSKSKEAMYQQVMGAGLPDGQDKQVLSLLGLTADEIDALDKKHEVGKYAPAGN